jgi:hypothetical protein
MNTKIKTGLRWVCLILVAGLSMSVASEHETTVDELFAAQRNHLLSVSAMDLVYSEDIEAGEHLRRAGKADFFGSPHRVFRYQMEGEKSRVETGLDGTVLTRGISPMIYTFDLENYQVYDKGIMDLYIK